MGGHGRQDLTHDSAVNEDQDEISPTTLQPPREITSKRL